jgi:hypothetical protein
MIDRVVADTGMMMVHTGVVVAIRVAADTRVVMADTGVVSR